MGSLQAQMNFKMDGGKISDNNGSNNNSLSAGRQTSKAVLDSACLP